MEPDKGIKFVCDMCGSLIEIGRSRYIFQGELFCAYDGGQFDETHAGEPKDFRKELERLIQIAESKTEKELMDEVYFHYRLDLCSDCRKKVYEYLDLLKR